MDGTTPAASTPGTCSHGSTYSSAISVSVSTVIRAIGTKTGLVNSSLFIATYVISAITPPSVYLDLVVQLVGDEVDFNSAVTALGSGVGSTGYFAGQLTYANCNNGPGLIGPTGLTLAESEVLQLKAVGATAVAVEVSFPCLYQPFMDGVSSGYQAAFVSFYTSLATYIHSLGMKVIVESQSLIPTGLQSTSWASALHTFYPSLTFSQYKADRASTAAVVANAMQPDYFVLQEEPDTETAQTGQPLDNPTNSTQMLNGSMAAVAGLVSGMKVGAGFGSWLQGFPHLLQHF